MDVATVAVIGGGTMGNGIAHVFALARFPVVLVDTKEEFLKRALATITDNMRRQTAKSILTPTLMNEALARLKLSAKLEDAAQSDIVIEAAPENLDLKRDLFAKLDNICAPRTILATNTSSIPIASLAAATKRGDRVIGMHFMNPVPVMKLVEIIRGRATSDETYETARGLTLKLGKVPACSNDFPGFISNRILMPMINEAAWALHQGVATKEDIDTVMKLGMNHPMGPLTLADYIGLDTCLAILKVLEEGFKDPKYKACPLFEQLVSQGRLGRKSGKGFYDY
ncbi:MAG: 3-hydroxybutyryl-CoA dehydrogenase [Elusimicrobia bacterium]|nr:3-hydroxybutyryl-CoA dehydrogenase [Elusimicrobiota bacterium]